MPPRPSSVFDAVLFDLDGTLIDTEPVWFAAEVDVMAAHGTGWTHDDQRIAVGGPMLRVADYMADLVAAAGGPRPDPREVVDALLEAYAARLPRADLSFDPHARAIFDEAKQHGLPCAVVSNSPRRLIEPILRANADAVFDYCLAGDEVARAKPHPAPYLTAAKALGADIARCLVVEDSPTGVAAGRASGAYVLALATMTPHDPHPRSFVVPGLAGISLAGLAAQLGRA